MKNIVITGCSSGIGLETALSLQSRGYRVIASCRKDKDFQHLVSLNLEAVKLDLNDSQSIHSAFNLILEKTTGQIDVLINNAGYGQAGALEDLSRELVKEQFETNVFGLLELTNLVIPLMRVRNEGRIINISSILGVINMPFRGAYNASKHALEALTDTWRLELGSSNIKVIGIQPGPIQSRFRENCVAKSLEAVTSKKSFFSDQYAQMQKKFEQQQFDSGFTLKPDAVVKKIIMAIESKNPRAKYAVTLPAHLLIVLKKILPIKLLDRLLLGFS